MLRPDNSLAGIDGVDLVVADAAIQNFLFAFRAIPIPFVAGVNQRNRRWEIVLSDLQCVSVLAVGDTREEALDRATKAEAMIRFETDVEALV